MTTDVSATLHASALETTTGVGAEVRVRTRGKVDFVLDVTAKDTATTLDVVIQGRDATSGKWVQLLDDGDTPAVLAFAQVGDATPTERITLPAGLADTYIRASWIIVGTSYTFSVSMIAKDN